ncbi:MAG: GNAT family N-acetyltransferase [Hyphomonadaceae bacterium]
MSAPVLETERLILRGHVRDDYDAELALWNDAGVRRNLLAGAEARPDEVWSRLLRYMGHWAAMNWGYWAIVERKSGRFIGECGFADFKRGLGVDLPEAGWAIRDDASGKGYAREAMRTALAWADERFGATFCIIAADNVRSIKLAQKLGFEIGERIAFKDAETLVCRRMRPARQAGGMGA